jgi:hypothetical protein
MRVVVYNHVRTRNIGRFRATAPVHDHGHGDDCHCGGSCDDCKEHSRLGLRDKHQRDDAYQKTTLGIDVKYAKGPMGRKIYETRHYTVPGFLVDPRGYGPQPAGVAAELRRQSEHGDMIRAGWTAEKVEGHYKQTKSQMSDLGRKEV